jgi:hypothetical protein
MLAKMTQVSDVAPGPLVFISNIVKFKPLQWFSHLQNIVYEYFVIADTIMMHSTKLKEKQMDDSGLRADTAITESKGLSNYFDIYNTKSHFCFMLTYMEKQSCSV